MPENLPSSPQETSNDLPTKEHLYLLGILRRLKSHGLHRRDFYRRFDPDPRDIAALEEMGLLKEISDGYLIHHLYYDDRTGAEAIFSQARRHLLKVLEQEQSRQERMEGEERLKRELGEDLLLKYKGKFVAICDGKIVADDKDQMFLLGEIEDGIEEGEIPKNKKVVTLFIE